MLAVMLERRGELSRGTCCPNVKPNFVVKATKMNIKLYEEHGVTAAWVRKHKILRSLSKVLSVKAAAATAAVQKNSAAEDTEASRGGSRRQHALLHRPAGMGGPFFGVGGPFSGVGGPFSGVGGPFSTRWAKKPQRA